MSLAQSPPTSLSRNRKQLLQEIIGRIPWSMRRTEPHNVFRMEGGIRSALRAYVLDDQEFKDVWIDPDSTGARCSCQKGYPCAHTFATLRAFLEDEKTPLYNSYGPLENTAAGHNPLVIRMLPDSRRFSLMYLDEALQIVYPFDDPDDLEALLPEHGEIFTALLNLHYSPWLLPRDRLREIFTDFTDLARSLRFQNEEGEAMEFQYLLPVRIRLDVDPEHRRSPGLQATITPPSFDREIQVEPGPLLVLDSGNRIESDEHEEEPSRNYTRHMESKFAEHFETAPLRNASAPLEIYALDWPEWSSRVTYYLNRQIKLDELIRLKDQFHRLGVEGIESIPDVFKSGPKFVVSLYPKESGDKNAGATSNDDLNLEIEGRLEIAYADRPSDLKLKIHEKGLRDLLEEENQKANQTPEGAPPIQTKSRAIPGPDLALYPPRPLYRYQRQGNRNPIMMDRQGLLAFRSPRKEASLLESSGKELPLKCQKSTGIFKLGPRRIRSFLVSDLPRLRELEIPLRIHKDLLPIFQNVFARSVFQIEESSGTNWFEGHIEIRGMDGVDRARMIQAIREKREFARLKNGAWVSLDNLGLSEIIQSLENLGLQLRKDGSVTRISLGEMTALSREEARLEVQGKKNIKDFLNRIRNLNDKDLEVSPQLFHKVLRHYQLQGAAFLYRLYKMGVGGILADDMGLGKTLQALALVDRLRREKKQKRACLLVCPLAALSVWQAEAKRFFPDLPVNIWHGNKRQDEKPPADGLLLTTFGVLIRDHKVLEKQKFRLVLVDEAQNAKNHNSRAHKALCALNREVLFGLTGTPMENHLSDLWSLMELSFPGLLGRRTAFKKSFGKQDRDALDRLRKRIAPFVLRRTKEMVLTELPPRTETNVGAPMTVHQKALYEQTRREALRALKDAGKNYLITMLPYLTKLRRIACHPHLEEADKTDPMHSGKLAHLAELLEELSETSSGVLIFSQFTDVLTVVRRMLALAGHDYHYLDGQTPANRRAKQVEEFQAGGHHFFLISLKAGGTALTLHRADTVLHLDPWWNPAAERQATDRVHRMGQKRPVFMYRFYARETVEEKVLALQDKKRRLFDGLFGEGLTGENTVSREDIQSLLSDRTPVERE